MYKVYTKNGIALFISLCDDVEPNKGGYYCEVYLDEDGITEFDNFVIHKEDLFSFENKSEGIICYFAIAEKEYFSKIIIYVYFCYIASNDLLLCMVLSSKQ